MLYISCNKKSVNKQRSAMDLIIICNHYVTMYCVIQQFNPKKFEYNLQLKKSVLLIWQK